MAFIDEMSFYAKAGKGGDGVVRWRHEKFIAKGGPNGGNGGAGAKVFARGIKNIHILSKYRHEKEFKAENGHDGEGGSRQGKYGDDLIIDFPIGSIITNKNTGKVVSLLEVGQKELLLTGGKGGHGNEYFKSSINTTPEKATKGEYGEDGHFHLELELFADVGLVGFPNAGKSSLINTLTNAGAKIGDYQFTTLEPNLGDFYGYIIADIPGLIEGASDGKGLGTKFLKHIKRTKMLLHLVSLEDAKDGVTAVIEKYLAIRKELEQFHIELKDKEEIVLLTKTDLVDVQVLAEVIKKISVYNSRIYSISLYDDMSMKSFTHELSRILDSKLKPQIEESEIPEEFTER